MKLRFWPTSPYTRKVSVTALETGLDARIERVDANPWAKDTDLPKDNPLGKIPALVTDEGMTLFDSRVICEYLDSLHDGEPLFPPAGTARWRALRQQALADGILDATVIVFIETSRRPEESRWPFYVERHMEKIRRALGELEREMAADADALTIGHITAGCALGYLDFRVPDHDWRADHPPLAEWYETFAARPSMNATVPHDP